MPPLPLRQLWCYCFISIIFITDAFAALFIICHCFTLRYLMLPLMLDVFVAFAPPLLLHTIFDTLSLRFFISLLMRHADTPWCCYAFRLRFAFFAAIIFATPAFHYAFFSPLLRFAAIAIFCFTTMPAKRIQNVATHVYDILHDTPLLLSFATLSIALSFFFFFFAAIAFYYWFCHTIFDAAISFLLMFSCYFRHASFRRRWRYYFDIVIIVDFLLLFAFSFSPDFFLSAMLIFNIAALLMLTPYASLSFAMLPPRFFDAAYYWCFRHAAIDAWCWCHVVDYYAFRHYFAIADFRFDIAFSSSLLSLYFAMLLSLSFHFRFHFRHTPPFSTFIFHFLFATMPYGHIVTPYAFAFRWYAIRLPWLPMLLRCRCRWYAQMILLSHRDTTTMFALHMPLRIRRVVIPSRRLYYRH